MFYQDREEIEEKLENEGFAVISPINTGVKTIFNVYGGGMCNYDLVCILCSAMVLCVIISMSPYGIMFNMNQQCICIIFIVVCCTLSRNYM
jgi:hypothetical protein